MNQNRDHEMLMPRRKCKAIANRALVASLNGTRESWALYFFVCAMTVVKELAYA